MASRHIRPLSDSHSDHHAIWQRALQSLRTALEPKDFDTYFAEVHAIEVRGGVLHLGMPTVIKLETIRARYQREIEKAVREASGRPMSIELRVAAPPEPRVDGIDHQHAANEPLLGQRDQPIQPAYSRPTPESSKTFDRFLEGKSNQIALAAARRVAALPGEDYNPLFIHSNSGLGKTHLLHAITHITMQSRYTILISAEDYLRRFVRSLETGTRAQFQEKHESAEVLIIDDIQALGAKSGTQEEFFNLFNSLYQRKRQIVVASDVPPRLLSGLSERLVTRFESGLIVDIEPPDPELRYAIVEQEARFRNIALDEPTIGMISERGGNSVSWLLGVLNRVSMAARTLNSVATPSIVAKAIADYGQKETTRTKPTIADLITATSVITGVAPELFIAPRKDRRTARARQLVMYLADRYTDHSLAAIGAALGGRDHSTVVHGRNKVRQMLDSPEDPQSKWWIQQVSELRARLRLD